MSMTRANAPAFVQLRFLASEIALAVNRKCWRWFTIWFGGAIWVNIGYRVDRFLYLLLGRLYPVIRPAFFPFFLFCMLIGGRHEIHYQANIGRGLRILHSALGTVISKNTVAGERLTLTGGNLIGGRKQLDHGDILIGSRVYVGAHAIILGPAKLGDRVQVGAGAVVVSDVPPGSVVVGVPAKEVTK